MKIRRTRIVYLLGLVFTLNQFTGCSVTKPLGIESVRVQGKAMEPGLKEGDTALFSRDTSVLKRGDIVIFLYPRDTSKAYVKRIVALPDEVIEIRSGLVLINGQAIEEPYVAVENNRTLLNLQPVKVPAESYYVLGDNRDNSSDSRFWGTVARKLIYGKFISKY